MYVYTYIGGWGVVPTGKLFRFRFVRAMRSCVCACETMLLPIAGFVSPQNPPAGRALACRLVAVS